MPIHICKMLKTTAKYLLHSCECQHTLLSQNSRTGQISKSHPHSMVRIPLTKFFLLPQSLVLSLSKRFRIRYLTHLYPSIYRNCTPSSMLSEILSDGSQIHLRLDYSLLYTQIQATWTHCNFLLQLISQVSVSFLQHILQNFTKTH